MSIDLSKYPPNGRYRCRKGRVAKSSDLVYWDGENLDPSKVGEVFITPFDKDTNGNALTFTMSNAESWQVAFLVLQKKIIELCEAGAKTPSGTPLPEGFPARDKLLANGIEYLESVPTTSAGLTAVAGVGEATAKKILEAMNNG